MRGRTQGPTSITDFEGLLAASDRKLELLEGEVVAFAGGPVAHGVLCSRLPKIIANATQAPCQAFTSDVAVCVANRNTYVFPDVSRTCEELDGSATFIVAPDLVVEVLSRSTAAIDRGVKFGEYRRIPTLEEIVLVDSAEVLVEVWRRGPDFWTFKDYGAGAIFRLESIPVDVNVDTLYDDIEICPSAQGIVDAPSQYGPEW